MPPQRVSEELQRGVLVPSLGDEAFQDLALVLNGPPEIVLHSAYFCEDLVEISSPVTERSHRLHMTPADLCGEDNSETVPPEPLRLVGDVDTAFMQQVLDVAQRQRVTDIHHHRQTDDLGRRLEVAEKGGVWHEPS